MNPKVGIFWFYEGKIIFSHAVPLEVGEYYGDAITGVKDHADYWEELRCEGKLNALDEPLRDEYFSIPRGRVVYHSDTNSFFVYHGNNVKKKDLRKVASFFNLPKEKTIFEQDLHYCDFDDSEWKLFF